MREVTITNGHETWSMAFPKGEMNDSAMLHHLLCYVDPGDDYTVTFKNA